MRALVVLAYLVTLPGCFLRKAEMTFDEQLNHFQTMAAQAQYPEVEVVLNETLTQGEPSTLKTEVRKEFYLSPEQAVQFALANSPVLRDLGGQVLQAPYAAKTIHNPAIVETDPRYGVEAALSAFDAEFYTAFYAENNDYVVNNRFLGGGTNQLQQDRNVLTMQVSKRAATGTEYYLRHNTDYDANNAPGNLFPSAYNVNVEAEFRHPLFQGSGVEFNRIAGPGATPGNYNGVVIARLNADVSLLDFELAVRDLVNNVENAYWDLYFAYRDLEAKVEARERTRAVWAEAQERAEELQRPDLEPQAREQYFRFKEEVYNALSGRVVDGTRANNGSSGGTFRGWSGVQVAERRLRLLMGFPINDDQMIVPTHEPFAAEIVYDWNQISGEAIARRAELRRQRLLVKRREMELIASRNFLLPRVDAFGRYRIRGFGDDLLHPNSAGRPQFDNAYMELTSGDYQEWRVGAELRFPVGFRQAHAGVRNAQLLLARDKAVLLEQERQVVYDLSNAVSDVKRSYETMQAALNRRISAQKQVDLLDERKNSLNATQWISAMLDAQSRASEATTRYHATRVEYIVAVKNLHLEKGSLLEYNNIFMAENLPAVVTNGETQPGQPSDAPPGATTEGPEVIGPGAQNPAGNPPGPQVPETTNEGLRGAPGEAGPDATPPLNNSAGTSPSLRVLPSSEPTPLAVDLRNARDAAAGADGLPQATGAPVIAQPGISTVHPTDGRPPLRPGEGQPSGNVVSAPAAPRAQIRDMWAPGGYGDPAVAVPVEGAPRTQAPVVSLPGATQEKGEGESEDRLAPPDGVTIPAVPRTPELPMQNSGGGAFAPSRETFEGRGPTAPTYVPPPEPIRGPFADPSVAVPDDRSEARRGPVAPRLAETLAQGRATPPSADPNDFAPSAALPTSDPPSATMPRVSTGSSVLRPNPTMTPASAPALDAAPGATIAPQTTSTFVPPAAPAPRNTGSAFIVPRNVAPPTVDVSVAVPADESRTSRRTAMSGTNVASEPSVAEAPPTPIVPAAPAPAVASASSPAPESVTPSSGTRSVLRGGANRGGYGDPSVSIEPRETPRPVAPPISARRSREESPYEPESTLPAPAEPTRVDRNRPGDPSVPPSVSANDPGLRRLPTTGRVTPASGQSRPGTSTRQVNRAEYYQPTR